jgi:transposase
MKYVKPLTEAERVTLQEAWKYGPTARVRQRAHALYLSAQGFRIPQLVPIFEVDRDTLSGWIDDWERDGLVGLFDAPRAGRPPIYSAEQQQRLRELVDAEPRQLKPAQAELAAETGKTASTRTLSRALKKTVAIRLEALPAVTESAA